MELQQEGKAPPMLISCWPQVLASAKPGTRPPTPRVLRSDDESVWILAPRWEGSNIRGDLVLVRGQLSGQMLLRDIDKPLLTYKIKLPKRQSFGWVEAKCLLPVES